MVISDISYINIAKKVLVAHPLRPLSIDISLGTTAALPIGSKDRIRTIVDILNNGSSRSKDENDDKVLPF